MKKSNLLVSVIISLVLILTPFVTVLSFAVFAPSQYSNTFVGVLDDKYDRLTSVEGEKVVVVGGSSVAFGLDSEAMEEYIGKPVVNFGLYAALGTKVMLDLSVDAIGEGDIVVIAPELDAQTLSLYFSSQTTLKAIDDDFSLFFKASRGNMWNMLGGMWEFGVEKLKLLTDGEDMLNPEGVYNASSFDPVYYDISYPREENTMWAYYETQTPVYLEADKYGSDFYEFCDYLNEYIAKCEAKGAKVCFSFCPVNRLALSSGSIAGKDGFVKMLEDNINCEFISSIDDYIINEAYFYDTNFHLNDVGVELRTKRLTRDLRLAYQIPTSAIDADPEPPELPERDTRFFGEDENAVYFEFIQCADGTYAVCGLTELGKEQTTLTIPLGYNGYIVTSVYANAFSGGSVERINVPANTNLRSFENGSFNDTPNLVDLYMYYEVAENILPPAYFSGVGTGFKVHVPKDSNYTTDYYWSERGLTFVQDIIPNEESTDGVIPE